MLLCSECANATDSHCGFMFTVAGVRNTLITSGLVPPFPGRSVRPCHLQTSPVIAVICSFMTASRGSAADQPPQSRREHWTIPSLDRCATHMSVEDAKECGTSLSHAFCVLCPKPSVLCGIAFGAPSASSNVSSSVTPGATSDEPM